MKRAIKKEQKPPKPCAADGCKRLSKPGYRFCQNHLGWLYAEMFKSKYLSQDKTRDP